MTDEQKEPGSVVGVGLPPLVRLRPTVGNMAVMLDVFAGCIETGIFPQPDSPAHHSIRWLVSDSGIKTRRIRTRLAKAKPKNFQA